MFFFGISYGNLGNCEWGKPLASYRSSFANPARLRQNELQIASPSSGRWFIAQRTAYAILWITREIMEQPVSVRDYKIPPLGLWLRLSRHEIMNHIDYDK